MMSEGFCVVNDSNRTSSLYSDQDEKYVGRPQFENSAIYSNSDNER